MAQEMGFGGRGGVHPTPFPPKKISFFGRMCVLCGCDLGSPCGSLFFVYSDCMDTQVIQIEDGIPPPARVVHRYPHAQLGVGQSFAVPFTVANRRNVLNANVRAAKKLGWSFTTRTEQGVIRVWRVS